MSDRFPPDEGPDPYEGHDLDGLLSGTGDSFPEGLRQVAHTLDALRVAPLPAELGAEAAARAAFRRLRAPGAGEPPWAQRGAGESPTLILPAGATAREARSVPGRHRRRRSPQRWRWQAKAMVGAAAAAVVVVAATALASTLSGSGGHSAVAGSAAASTAARATASGSRSAQVSAAPEGTAKPDPKTSPPSSPSATELCLEYFDFFTHPGRQSASTVEDVYDQLRSLAEGQGGVGYYCMRVLQFWSAPVGPGNVPGTSGYPLPGDIQGHQGAQGADKPSGPGANGNGNNGNGQGNSGNGRGGNGPGSGQNQQN
jgi:hypothetical protein